MRKLHVPAIAAATLVIICTVFLGLITPTHAATRTLAWDPNPESDLAGYRIYQRILPSLNFQEIFRGMPPSPQAPAYTVTGLEPGNTYNFIVTAYNQSGNEGPPSNEVSAVIPAASGTPPSITTQPANVTVTAPQPATFRVVATGDPPLSYQWQRNGTTIVGATSASYTLDPTREQDHGATFAVVVSNPAGTVTSAAATLTMLGDSAVAWEAVAQNPTGIWRNSTWSNRSFRILLDGALISASGSTVQLTLRGRPSGNYTVQRVSLVRRDGSTLNGVNSTFAKVTFGGSWDAGVTVLEGGTVTSDPIPFDLIAGQDVFLTFWAPSGHSTVYLNEGSDTSAWVILDTDHSPTIDWANLTIDLTRTFVYIAERLEVVQGGNGTPPSVTTPPADVTVTAPQPATFQVVATGDPPLSYQWQRNGTTIVGATSASYTLDPTREQDHEATFAVVVSNPAGTVTSAAATLTIETQPTPPTITTPPANVTVTAPQPATFRVVATGDPPLSYQWQRNGTTIVGATSASYTLDPTREQDHGATFAVVVSNPAGTVTSAAATLTMLGDSAVAWEAVAQNPTGIWRNSTWSNRSFRILLDGALISASGSTVQLTLRGRPSGNYTVQRVSLVRRDGSTLNGVNSTFAKVTFGGSWDAGVTVLEGGTVTSDPIPFDLIAGQDVFLTFWAPSGHSTVYLNEGSDTSAWVILDTDHSPTIDWANLTIDLTRTFVYIAERLEVVQGGNGTPPSVTTPPADVTVTAPQPATFQVVATGDPPLSYQWQRNGTTIVGATSASYTLDPTREQDHEATFAVVVSNPAGTVTSAAATLNVLGEPAVAWEAVAQNPTGTWRSSGWSDRSFRVLLDGALISASGTTVQLTLRGRWSGSYNVQRVSLVRRDGSTLNGVDSTFAKVTFGGSWDAGVTVLEGDTVTSDPIPFDLIAGQDVFLTFWVPSGQSTVYLNEGSDTSAWTIMGADQSATIDWSGLSIANTRTFIYLAERLEVF